MGERTDQADKAKDESKTFGIDKSTKNRIFLALGSQFASFGTLKSEKSSQIVARES
jgi:hypothetical protein